MPAAFRSLDLLRALNTPPPRVLAECADCREKKPCLLFRVGPTAPDGGETSMAVCEECRTAHEAIEVTP